MTNKNYRNSNRIIKRPHEKSGGAFKWKLITGLLIGLVVFGVYLKSNALKKLKQHLPQSPTLTNILQVVKPEIPAGLSSEEIEKLEQQPNSLPPEVVTELENGEAPQFEFYTILQAKEVIVPIHEIMTRTHAESVNAPVETLADSVDVTKPTISVDAPVKSTVSYMMQAGSFKNSTDAEKMRVNLEYMGIEARVEKAKVGEIIYHRIKMGPYAQMTIVSTIRTRLKQSGIDVIVTETSAR